MAPHNALQYAHVGCQRSTSLLMERNLICTNSGLVPASPITMLESFAIAAAGPPFSTLPVGLSYRAIPALGACTQQFQPVRVSASLAHCRRRLLKGTNNVLLTHRKTVSLDWRAAPFAPGRPNRSGHERKTKNMLCKNRITLIGFLGQDAETRFTPNGNQYTRFSLATNVSWKENGHDEYKMRTEWHRVICWNKLADWAGNLQKGAYVEVEGELRYREYTPTESDRSVRVAEIYATSILALDRSAGQTSMPSAESDSCDEPVE